MGQRYDALVTKQYVAKALQAYGVKENHAKIVSEVLVEADMRGIESHGINGLPHLIIEPIQKGMIRLDAEPKVMPKYQNLPTLDAIDANGCLGHVASMMAAIRAKELARKYGTASVHVIHSFHFGAAGIYSGFIAQEGDLMGQAFCISGSSMIPYGGVNPRLGTNPIAWSIPYRHIDDERVLEGMVTLDAATSTRAVNVIVKALREGYTELPFAVVDLKTGRPTTNPKTFAGVEDFFRNAGVMPAGGMEGMGEGSGYKMGGLAWQIELQTIPTGGFSGEIQRLPLERKIGVIRQTFRAEAMAAFRPLEAVLDDVYSTIQDIKKIGKGKILYPGEREETRRQDVVENGIPYTPSQIKILNQISESTGIKMLQPL